MRENPCPYPLQFTLWYTKIKNLHKTGKLERGLKHISFLQKYLKRKHPKMKN